MSKIQIRHPEKTVSTGAYSDGILVDGWLYISGQGPLNLATGEVMHGTIEEETLLTLSHIKKIIEEAGGSLNDIVKCTVHLKDINDFEKFNAAYSSFFPDIKQARTTVQSVLFGGINIEIHEIVSIEVK